MKAENSNEFESGYRKGFYDGILEGQKGGIEIASNAIATSVRPIQIQMPDSETARLVAKGLRADKLIAEIEKYIEKSPAITDDDAEFAQYETGWLYAIEWCLDRLKGVE